MTTPPQGGWQPDPHGRPPHGQPQYGPPQGYPGPQPPGFPPGQWPQQPPPAKGGGSLKWLLVAVAVLLVISISVGVTLIVTREDGDEPSQTAGANTSDIASANDTGPVAIIMEEPTCKAFNTINNSLADIVANGWAENRAQLGSLSEWSPQQREQVQAVSLAMRNAADQAVALARETPNRVVREIYDQFIAFGRAYADSVATYTPRNDNLASANVSASGALIGICNSIEYESAGRSIAVEPLRPPSELSRARNPADAGPFLSDTNGQCGDWVARLDQFIATTPDWQTRDGSIPASQWTAERVALERSTVPLLEQYASQASEAGRASGNPVFEDLAETAALYIRSYTAASEQYVQGDSWLQYTGFRISNLIAAACQSGG